MRYSEQVDNDEGGIQLVLSKQDAFASALGKQASALGVLVSQINAHVENVCLVSNFLLI